MNTNPIGSWWAPSAWAPSAFGTLVANHPGRVTLIERSDLQAHCEGFDAEISVATYTRPLKFATMDPFPIIEIMSEVTHFPRAVWMLFDIPLLPPMPEKLALGFQKKFDECTERIFSTERSRANFDLGRAPILSDGRSFAIFLKAEGAR